MKKKPCKLISFDTSTSSTGYAVYLNGKLDSYGNLALSKDEKQSGIPKHLIMTVKILSLLGKEKPDIIVTELTCVPKGTETQRMLDRILGNLEVWAFIHNTFYDELRPSVWRSRVRGNESLPNGRTLKKEWSKSRVFNQYGITVNDDISDAILIGEAYIKMFH